MVVGCVFACCECLPAILTVDLVITIKVRTYSAALSARELQQIAESVRCLAQILSSFIHNGGIGTK